MIRREIELHPGDVYKQNLVQESQRRIYMLNFFRDVQIHVDRFPKRTVKFENILAKLNNHVLVPVFEMLPARVKRPFGWHIMIRATK